MLSRIGSTDSTGGGSSSHYNNNSNSNYENGSGVRRRTNRRTNPVTISQYDLIQQQQEQQLRAESWRQWQETIEYFLFLIVGGTIWIIIAWKVLQWQKFPFHLYPVEVGFIFVAPVVLLAGLLFIAEWLSRPRSTANTSISNHSLVHNNANDSNASSASKITHENSNNSDNYNYKNSTSAVTSPL